MTGMTPFDKVRDVMSGNSTRRRVDAADNAAAAPATPAAAPAAAGPVVKPKKKFVNARQRAIDKSKAQDLADIQAMNAKNSLRRQ